MVASGEAQLMRTCAPLYGAFALESFSNICLFLAFTYLVLIIQARGELSMPARAVWRLLWRAAKRAAIDVWTHLVKWPHMNKESLKSRFTLCRKLNTVICGFTAVLSLLATTRWLHVGNVNGFRYLGYSFTCPIMQAELIMLIGDVVPCYKLNVVLVATVTFAMLVSGYAASLMHGELFTGSVDTFLSTWDWNDLELTNKAWVLTPSMLGIIMLTFIQMPYLAFVYTVKGGVKAGLPYQYRTLLLLVAVTWWGFPIWWLLNWQGMSVITDAKLNGAGFCILNLVSKGGFTQIILSSSRWHKTNGWGESKAQKLAAQKPAAQNDPSEPTMYMSHGSEASRDSEITTDSVDTSMFACEDQIPWIVKFLKRYDGVHPPCDQMDSESNLMDFPCDKKTRSSQQRAVTLAVAKEQDFVSLRTDMSKVLNHVEMLCSSLKIHDQDLPVVGCDFTSKVQTGQALSDGFASFISQSPPNKSGFVHSLDDTETTPSIAADDISPSPCSTSSMEDTEMTRQIRASEAVQLALIRGTIHASPTSNPSALPHVGSGYPQYTSSPRNPGIEMPLPPTTNEFASNAKKPDIEMPSPPTTQQLDPTEGKVVVWC